MSIQVAILKVLASHGSGCAPLDSLNRDIAVLTASGAEWSARIRRLATRVPKIDIFGDGHVLRRDDGWEITPSGRAFLAALEAITQDNLLPAPEEAVGVPEIDADERGGLIVVGHRFRNRVHRPGSPARKVSAGAGGAAALRGDG